MSQVTSKPMVDGRAGGPIPPPAKARRIHWDRLPLALLGWLIFGLWWAAGGKYTIDGLPLLANEVFGFFRVPVELSPVSDWRWYIGLCWLPFLISIAERRYAPWRRLAWSFIMVWVIFVWVVVSAVDGGSTYLAVTNPPPDARELSKQVAKLPLVAAVWSVATTFAPETGMAMLWWWLRKG